MRQNKIQDRIRWGLNCAAQATGELADAYRPCGHTSPLTAENRFLRLPALFTGTHGRFQRPAQFGESMCHGIFDAAYTRAGDYLVQEDATWFIASQQPLLPVLCVRANRTVSFYRPEVELGIADGNYGGVSAEARVPLLENWPASVLGVLNGGHPAAGLPSDSDVSQWTVLLPCSAQTLLQPADLMSDDLGRSAVVCSAEKSELGWRLLVKQAVT